VHFEVATPARSRLATSTIFAIWVAGCTGVIADPRADDHPRAADGRGADHADSGVGAARCSPDEIAPGPSPLRRLTRWEYDNTIRDLLGDDSRPASAFPEDERALGFDNNAEFRVVTTLLAEHYMLAAESIAARAVADRTRLLPCTPDGIGEEACGRQFVEVFGSRAWRRPLDTEEIENVTAVFAWGLDTHGFSAGIELVIQVLLQSPQFLYRLEGIEPSLAREPFVALSGWEMASRLSYFLWGTMPDEMLFAAAAADELGTPEEVADQARRMLDDPRGAALVWRFHEQWLGLEGLARLEKDVSAYPLFTSELGTLYRLEAEHFVREVVFTGEGTLTALFTAPYTFMDSSLAAVYGVETGAPAGVDFERVELDATRRAGLLTQGGLLARLAHANQSSPVRRGKFVREQLLCELVPPPPPDVMVTAPELDPGLTTRERFAQHRADPACSACHELMDPIGLGFESFDGLGMYRSHENGLLVDDSGEVVGSDVAGSFSGAVELATKLGDSRQVRNCVVTQWFRFAHGRGETPEDRCTLDRLQQAFTASGTDIRELLVDMTQTEAFLHRTAAAPGGGE
jgi:hypothetical protein